MPFQSHQVLFGEIFVKKSQETFVATKMFPL